MTKKLTAETQSAFPEPRRRGRPPGANSTPADRLLDILAYLHIYRLRVRLETGRTPSYRRACRELVNSGGLIWILGIPPEFRSAYVKKHKRLPPPCGSSDRLYVVHSQASFSSLQARVDEAKASIRGGSINILTFKNRVRMLIGRAVKRPDWMNPNRCVDWSFKNGVLRPIGTRPMFGL